MSELPETPDGPEPEGIPQTAAELLLEAADLEPPVEVHAAGPLTEYRIGDRAFAAAAPDAFEVDLGPEVAAAALRTPDAGASSRGAGWVRLATPAIDDHAADRIVSWFELARRIAAGRRGPGGVHRA